MLKWKRLYMLRFITKLACAGFILALPLQAMQLQQEQFQAKKLKSLKVQALLKVALSPQISDEQINRLPQDLRKIARLIRGNQARANENDLGGAIWWLLKTRKDVLEVARTLARSAKVDPNLFVHDFWYTTDDIRLLISCCKDERSELYLLYAIPFQDNELLELIGKETLSEIVRDQLEGDGFLLQHLLRSVNGHKFDVDVKSKLEERICLAIAGHYIPF